MATKFTVKDAKGTTVFEGIGGDANAWAKRNVARLGDLFVHYNNIAGTVLHWFIGETVDEWGTRKGITSEWVEGVA